MHRLGAAQCQCAAGSHQHVCAGRRHLDGAGIHGGPFLDGGHVQRGPFGKNFHEQAAVSGIEVLHHHHGQREPSRQVRYQLLESLDATGGRAYHHQLVSGLRSVRGVVHHSQSPPQRVRGKSVRSRPLGFLTKGGAGVTSPRMVHKGDSVLVVDDDPEMRAVMRDILTDEGFTVTEAATAHEARERAATLAPDLVLLDLGLPDASGLDVLTELTRADVSAVIVVSARAGETDRVVGLDLGADDYIVKPFSERELVARVKATLRKARRHSADAKRSFGDMVIDDDSREVSIGGIDVELTAKEFDLLSFLTHSPRRVFTRGQLLEQVWESSPDWQNDATVAEHVHRLRAKLDPDDRFAWIETVRGVGYRFAPPG